MSVGVRRALPLPAASKPCGQTAALALLVVVFAGACTQPNERSRSLRVLAAASLAAPVAEIVAGLGGHGQVTVSYAGSGVLGRQIESGARVDLFLSAHPGWVERLRDKGLLAVDGERSVAANALVLIAPRGLALRVDVVPGFDIGASFSGPLAVADPDSVPAGLYAREALRTLGWWSSVAKRVVGTADVRAALALVERGECQLGIVYASDARASERARTVAVLPQSLHTPIRYVGAILRDGQVERARALLERFAGADGAAVFRKHGFLAAPEKHADARA